MQGFSLQSWSDLADLATVLSLPVIILAVIMTGRQITSQLTATRREASFAAYLHFAERFDALMAMQVELAERFDRGDRTLNLKTVSRFFVQYWILQINHWEMFRAGLLPSAVYASWLVYTHDNIAGDVRLGYFEGRGKARELSSRDAFQLIFLRRMVSGQPECAQFFRDLEAIPHGWSPESDFEIHDAPGSAERVAAIQALVEAKATDYRARPLWKLA